MINGTQITVVGNLAEDPEMRYTATGIAVTNFRIGVQNRRVQRNGEWVDTGTTWYRVNVWRDLAENAAQSLSRGTRVIVVGTLESRQWEDREGIVKYSWEITADACGPDLQYANVAVARTKRTQPTQTATPETTKDDTWAASETAGDGTETADVGTGEGKTNGKRSGQHRAARGKTPANTATSTETDTGGEPPF